MPLAPATMTQVSSASAPAAGPAGSSADCTPLQPLNAGNSVRTTARLLLILSAVAVALSLHIAFLSVWAATLLYLPLLLARQAAAEDDHERQRLELMQRWLYAAVMTPSAVLTVLFGVWLIFERGFEGGWLPVKLLLVLLMGLFHVYCGRLLGSRTEARAGHRPLYYYALMPAPLLLILGVVTLVTAKPF